MKYTNVILSVVLVVVLTVSVFLICKILSIQNRIDTTIQYIEEAAVSDAKSRDELPTVDFRETYYIQQQSRDTTLIIFLFGIVVTAFGLVSFKVFDIRVTQETEKMRSKYDAHAVEYKNQEHRIDELMLDFCNKTAEDSRQKALEQFQNGHIGEYIDSMIYGLRYFADSYKLSLKIYDKKTGDIILGNMVKDTENMLGFLKGDNCKVRDVNLTNYFIMYVRQLGSPILEVNLTKIQMKLVNEEEA